MLAVEREYLCEEIKKCSLCNKWIETKYIVIIDGIRNKYYHHKCYKCFFERYFSEL